MSTELLHTFDSQGRLTRTAELIQEPLVWDNRYEIAEDVMSADEPTSDPLSAGQLYNLSGVLMVSAG